SKRGATRRRTGRPPTSSATSAEEAPSASARDRGLAERLGQGEAGHGAALVFARAELDLAAVHRDQLLHDREAEARAGRLRGHEGLEDPIEELERQALPLVPHLDDDRAATVPARGEL